MAHDGRRDDEETRREKLAQLVLRQTRLTDDEVIQLRDLFGEIVATHDEQVRSQLRQACLSREEVDELRQEAFLRLYRSIAEHGFPNKVAAKLHEITDGVLSNFVRRRKRAPQSACLPSSGSEKPPTSGPDVERAVAQRELAYRFLDELSPDHRDVVEQVIMGGLSHEDAAHALRLPEGTVKSRLLAAKRILAGVATSFLTESERGIR